MKPSRPHQQGAAVERNSPMQKLCKFWWCDRQKCFMLRSEPPAWNSGVQYEVTGRMSVASKMYVCVRASSGMKPAWQRQALYTLRNAAQPDCQVSTPRPRTCTHTPSQERPSHWRAAFATYPAWRAPPSPGRPPAWRPPPVSRWYASWAAAAPACRWSCSRCRWGRGDPWPTRPRSSSTRCSAANTSREGRGNAVYHHQSSLIKVICQLQTSKHSTLHLILSYYYILATVFCLSRAA